MLHDLMSEDGRVAGHSATQTPGLAGGSGSCRVRDASRATQGCAGVKAAPRRKEGCRTTKAENSTTGPRQGLLAGAERKDPVSAGSPAVGRIASVIYSKRMNCREYRGSARVLGRRGWRGENCPMKIFSSRSETKPP